jgi:hypothetical protein
MVNGGAIDYSTPLHARHHVGKRKPDAVVYDGAGRVVGEAFKVSSERTSQRRPSRGDP